MKGYKQYIILILLIGSVFSCTRTDNLWDLNRIDFSNLFTWGEEFNTEELSFAIDMIDSEADVINFYHVFSSLSTDPPTPLDTVFNEYNPGTMTYFLSYNSDSLIACEDYQLTVFMESADSIVQLEDTIFTLIIPDTWDNRASLPLAAGHATSFSLGNNGYYVFGRSGNAGNLQFSNQLYEFDAEANSWSERPNIPAAAREGAIAFTIGDVVYLGLGYNGNELSDLWRFSPGNEWVQLTDFPGGARSFATGFSVGNRGYICCGFDGENSRSDCWEYNPNNDNWQEIGSYPGGATHTAQATTINDMAYIGGGISNNDNSFFSYDGNDWQSLTQFPYEGVSQASLMALEETVILTHGFPTNPEVWSYDRSTNEWTSRNNHVDFQSYGAIEFVIEGKIYLGGGIISPDQFSNRFQRYTP